MACIQPKPAYEIVLPVAEDCALLDWLQSSRGYMMFPDPFSLMHRSRPDRYNSAMPLSSQQGKKTVMNARLSVHEARCLSSPLPNLLTPPGTPFSSPPCLFQFVLLDCLASPGTTTKDTGKGHTHHL